MHLPRINSSLQTVITALSLKTLQELFDQYWLDTGKSEDDKRDKKAKALWQEFLLLSGGNTICEKTVRQDAHRCYANAKLE